MAWSTPKTWVLNDPGDATNLNQYVRDNQNYLKDRVDNEAKQYVKTGSGYSTTSTTFVDVDATNMAHTITTTGGDVRVTVSGYGTITGAGSLLFLGFDVDSTEYNVSVDESANSGDFFNVSWTYIITGLSAGSHTFKLIYKVSAGTGTLAENIVFDVREDIGIAA